jgi:Mycothiol maleylpyruvate isomerase N-terminal domain
MKFPYAQQNTESRQRLTALVRRLSDTDLALSTDYGWTVAALLAHLAFWDHRMSVILKRWQTEGLGPSEIDSAAVNDALRVVCHALEPRTAAELAITAAEKIDSELEELTAEYVKQLEEHAAATNTQFRMNRSLHRTSHVDDIEALLK